MPCSVLLLAAARRLQLCRQRVRLALRLVEGIQQAALLGQQRLHILQARGQAGRQSANRRREQAGEEKAAAAAG